MAKKSERKKLVEKLDKVFSLVIRQRGEFRHKVCFFCRREPIQNAFHWITRGKYATRWAMENAEGSCAGCNLRNEYEPAPFIQWFLKSYGQDAFDALILKSNQIAKFSNSDLQAMHDNFKGMLSEN